MKTLKTLLSVFAIAAVFSAGAYAQSGNGSVESTDIAAKATVLANISIATTDSLQFGEIVGGSSPQVTNTGSSGITGTPTLGKIEISGSATLPIYVTVSETSSSLGDGNGNTMAFSPSWYGNSSDTPSGASNLNDGEQEVTLDGGSYFVYLGGSLTVGASQAPGSYSTNASNGGGDYTVSVQYK